LGKTTAFLLKWPTLQSLKKARKPALKPFYYLQGSRSQTLIEQRLERIDKAVSLTEEIALRGQMLHPPSARSD
jgi:hypothetical protein